MNFETLFQKAEDLDRGGPLQSFRDRFQLDAGVIYLDGNSLGPMMKCVPERLARTLVEDWASGLIKSWNEADWINLPRRTGDRIAPLIGAKPASVTVADSTSVNLFKVLSAALKLNRTRSGIVSEQGNFPTDLYIVDGVRAQFEGQHELHLAKTDEDILKLINEDTAVVLLTHVDFRTGRMLDMKGITEAVHAKGALVIWDLAHSAGAVPVKLDESDVDFAVGCGYKYLNGGPGAPSFLYVNEKHVGHARQPLTGWFSHQKPFTFDAAYQPDQTINQYLCGTPPILSMIALEEALKIWDEVGISAVRGKSLGLTDFFLETLDAAALLAVFEPVTPRSHEARGSQVSLKFDGDGYAIMQALISEGVIGDYREPNILRFGFAPLYNSYAEVVRAVQILHGIMRSEIWRSERFSSRKAVT